MCQKLLKLREKKIFARNFPKGVIIVPKMLKRSPINFNSTRLSDSGNRGSYELNGKATQNARTHHFDIKIQTPFICYEFIVI